MRKSFYFDISTIKTLINSQKTKHKEEMYERVNDALSIRYTTSLLNCFTLNSNCER